MRVNLRSPFGGVVARDIVDGRWAEPAGRPDEELGSGWWALPGLVDAHAHVASDEMYQPGNVEGAKQRVRDSLRAGVTLLLDKGWSDDTVMQVMDQVQRGERPEMEAAAKIIAAMGGYFPGFAEEIEGADIVTTVKAAAMAGRGWVKLSGDWPRKGVGPVANFTEDELASAVNAAHGLGARVAIHTMAPDVPSMAVAAGVDSIEHGLFLSETDLHALADRKGTWVPTILRVEEIVAQLGESSSGGRLLTEGLARVKTLVAQAVGAGVHVLAGTDLVGSPANVGAEAVKLSEYGLSKRQALASVSVEGFEATGRGRDFSLGESADAVFFAVNPLDDLGVLAHPEAVIRLGRVL